MIDIDFKFYRGILWQRLPLILVIWLLVTAAAVTLAYVLPSVYRSNARILVEKPQIDVQTVPITSAEIIQNIQERLLTRATMLEINKKFGVLDGEPDLSPSERVREMRRAVQFRVIDLGQDPRSRTPSSTVFSVSFVADSPQLASQVTNELVTLILEQNLQIRADSVANTASFYQQQVTRLSNELTDLETQIVTFEQQNIDTLPNSLDFRHAEMSRVQSRVIQLDTQEQQLMDQRAQLVRMIADPTLMGQVPGTQQSPEEKQLLAMQVQLAQLRATFSESHPQVRALIAQMKVLEAQIRGVAPTTDTGSTNAAPSPLQTQIDQIDAQLGFLNDQRITLEAELQRLQATIEETPNVANQLNVLYRSKLALEGQYNSAIAQLNSATARETIEVNQQGERFEVIEQANVPDEPESPQRLLIAALGLFGGLGAGLGLVVLLELLNKSVRRPSELVSALGIQPFATVPYIATHAEIMRKRVRTIAGFAALLIGVPALLYIIHYQYMPIDLIISNLIERFGLDDLTRGLG